MFIEEATSWFEVLLFNCDAMTLTEPFVEAVRLYNIIIDSVLFLNSNIGDMTSPYDIHTFTIRQISVPIRLGCWENAALL